MSLKAKIEAVIYASEEPVTLAQLTGVLGQEAQSELDRIAVRQNSLHLAENEDESETAAEVEIAAALDVSAEPGVVLAEESVAEESGAEKRAAKVREAKVREFLRETVDGLIAEYQTSERGIEVREVAGGYRMATKPEYHDAVRGFVKSLKPPLKLSLQALETLAVVAYKQPVTSPEISEIRGVDSGGVLGSLMSRKLITTAGRKQVIGRPILYRTTKDFLLRFGLKDINELPSIEEFEKMAGELADMDPAFGPVEEVAMFSDNEEERITHDNLLEEIEASEPQADGDDRSLQPDDSNRPDDELPAIDGRLSGLPPTYDRPGDDPSADEAAIQSGE